MFSLPSIIFYLSVVIILVLLCPVAKWAIFCSSQETARLNVQWEIKLSSQHPSVTENWHRPKYWSCQHNKYLYTTAKISAMSICCFSLRKPEGIWTVQAGDIFCSWKALDKHFWHLAGNSVTHTLKSSSKIYILNFFWGVCHVNVLK